MNSQSLIFEGSRIEYLKLDDVSLRVKALRVSESRIPLRCLLRVHCHNEPANGFNTLLQLAERHIPVTFFDRRGHVRAQLYYPQPKPQPLALWLEHCFGEEAFQLQLDNWLASQQMALFANLDIHQGQLVERHAFLMAELAHFYQTYPHRFDEFLETQDQLRQLLLAHLGELLLAYGLPAGGSIRHRIFTELRDMLDFWLDGQVYRWLQRFPAPQTEPDARRKFYSYVNEALNHRVGLLLRQLQAFVEAYGLEQIGT